MAQANAGDMAQGQEQGCVLPTAAAEPSGPIISDAGAAGAGAGSQVVASAPQHLTKGSSRLGIFYRLTKQNPTNYDMLVFRTLNVDLKQPGHNQDTLARQLRDELMPVRSWWIRRWPGAKQQLRRTLESPLWGVPGCVNFIDARTKWLDDAVVLLAAGFDTRPYRLHAPGVTFFEVDLPHAVEEKKHLVSKLGWLSQQEGDGKPAASSVVHVAADLGAVAVDEALSGSGYDPRRPTCVLIEGLLYYLPQAAVGSLLDGVARMVCSGSRVYFDWLDAAALTGRARFPGWRVTSKAVANKGEPFLSAIEAKGDAVAAYLARHSLRLVKFWGPRDMVAQQLPHARWNDKKPPIASFYCYAAAIKP